MSLKAAARSPPSAAVVQMVAARAARRRHGDQNAKCVSFRKVWEFFSFVLLPVFESGAESLGSFQSLLMQRLQRLLSLAGTEALHCPLPQDFSGRGEKHSQEPAKTPDSTTLVP